MAIKRFHKSDCTGAGCTCPWRLDHRPQGTRGPRLRVEFATKKLAENYLAKTTSEKWTEDPKKRIVIERTSLFDPDSPTLKLHGNLVRQLKGPCVYVWLRGAEVLYVGKSSNGASRPLDSNHHRLRVDAIKDSDELLIWACNEGQELLVEARLIKELNPKFNDTRISANADNAYDAITAALRAAM